MTVGDLAGRVGLAGLATLLTLGVAETALRLFGPPPSPPPNTLRDFTQYDPVLGWRGVPGAVGPCTTHRFTTWVVLNREGRRDDEPTPAIPAGMVVPAAVPAADPRRCTIGLLGDSYAWGYGVNQEEMFAERLETLLPGCTVNNYGVPGYGTDQELLVLRAAALRERPRLVILEFAVGNDLRTIRSRRAYGLPKPRFLLEGHELRLDGVPVPRVERWERVSLRRDVRNFFATHINLYAWALPRWIELREKWFVAGAEGRIQLLARDQDQRLRDSWRLAEALLEAIRDAAAGAGAGLVLLVVPDRLQVDEALWEETVDAYDLDAERFDRDLPSRLLAGIGERLGIIVVDPSRELRDSIRNGRDVFIGEDPHWNPTGHEIAARVLAETLGSRLHSLDHPRRTGSSSATRREAQPAAGGP